MAYVSRVRVRVFVDISIGRPCCTLILTGDWGGKCLLVCTALTMLSASRPSTTLLRHSWQTKLSGSRRGMKYSGFIMTSTVASGCRDRSCPMHSTSLTRRGCIMSVMGGGRVASSSRGMTSTGPSSTGACTINRPCAQQYVGKSQSCMVIS